ncbi:PREDICTED: zinc finger protein 135-like isoform X2 [Poecilia mexicana]|uniref:C2H2-type domain-containing protein n=1 Tax=Poecilia mexicana TaxID=48701 RepID=A0A3B3XT59_9TELE|nr:PREDICTED: zinc finger protein 135-like isoform X2 [Poecilia mexicana]
MPRKGKRSESQKLRRQKERMSASESVKEVLQSGRLEELTSHHFVGQRTFTDCHGHLCPTVDRDLAAYSGSKVMPSVHGQNRFIMEKQSAVNTVASAQLGGEASAFICTECGDGFSQYASILAHMSNHGPLESFSFDGSSNGFDIPQEYVLQENGTLIVVNGLPQLNSVSSSNSSSTPMPPERPSSPLPSPVKPTTTTQNSQPFSNKDSLRPKPPGFSSDVFQQNHCRCEICNRSFSTTQSLHRHQQYGNSERGFRCTLCCKIFQDKSNLKKHLQDHVNEKTRCCGHCGKRFLKIEALNAHQKESHSMPKALGRPDSKEDKKPEKAYPCNKCKLIFFWMSDLQIHSLYHCKGQELDVELESDFETEENSKHSDDGELVNCHTNGQSNDTRNGGRKISRDGSIEKNKQPTFTPYRCGLCGDRFERLASLKEHHVTHQTQEEIDEMNKEYQKPIKRVMPPNTSRRGSNPNGKLHPCKHCHRVFNHSSSLSRHMRYHKGTMHTCVFCGRHFPQRCDLRRHVIMYHKAEGLKLLHSNSQNGPSSISADDEKQANNPEDNTKGSSDNEQTSTEQTGKAGRVNYKCQECGKKFGLLCVYQRHLRYHKKEPTKCPKTPADIQKNSSPLVHLQAHLDPEEPDDDGQKSPGTGNIVDEELKKDNPEDMEEDAMDQKQDEKGSSSEALYECTECTQTFSCLDTFLEHQASHDSETKAVV